MTLNTERTDDASFLLAAFLSFPFFSSLVLLSQHSADGRRYLFFVYFPFILFKFFIFSLSQHALTERPSSLMILCVITFY